MSQAIAPPAAAARVKPGLDHVLISSMKDEGGYIIEFVAHHRVLGFDGIYIASNDCSDGTDRLLEILALNDVIGHAPGKAEPGKGGPQHQGYDRLRRKFGLNRAQWLMVLDVDEFFYVSAEGGRVQDLTALAPADIDVIALNGLTFGTSDVTEAGADTRRVCARFTSRVPDDHGANGAVKSLTRAPERFKQIHNHSMVYFKPDHPVRVMQADASIYDLDRNLPEWRQLQHFEASRIRHELAHYNHYAIKSPEEFMLRQQRGRGIDTSAIADPVRHSSAYFADRALSATVTDTSILERYGAAVEAEIARLMALPGVAAAHARCTVWQAEALGRAEPVEAKAEVSPAPAQATAAPEPAPAAAPTVPPKAQKGPGTVLVSAMKNEGTAIVEYVAHHRVLGFDGIYIASNNCEDGSERLLARLAEGGAIAGHIDHDVPPGEGAQNRGFAKLIKRYGLDRADWLMPMDADEFLFVHAGGGRVGDLTARAGPEVDMIAVSSMYFGTTPDFEGWTPERTCRRFTRRLPAGHGINGTIKLLTRNPGGYFRMDQHSMTGRRGGGAVTVMRGDGSTFQTDPERPIHDQLKHFQPGDVSHAAAQYNHYAIKSPEEFGLRRYRGRGVDIRGIPAERKVRHTDDYFARHAAAATVEDRAILDRYGAEVEAEMARLRALPGVAEAEAECQAWIVEAIARMEGEQPG